MYRPLLDSLAVDLGRRYPAVRFQVYSGAIGSQTTYQGWQIRLEAVFAGRGSDEADCVALSIDLCHLDRQPRVMADVIWGAPSGECEASLCDWSGTQADLTLASRGENVERTVTL